MALLLLVFLQLQLPAPVGYVNDFASVIRPGEATALSGIIDEVRQKSGGEIVVVTLGDIGDRAPIDVARDIGRAWKVGAQGGAGDARRNAGVVLLLVPGQRPGDGRSQLAVASGTGAEGFVTDAVAGRVRDAVGREAASSGSFGQGLVAGVRLLGDAYAREFHFDLTGTPPPSSEPVERSPGGRRFPWGILVVVALLILASRRRGGGGLMSALLWGSILGGGRGGGGSWGGGGGGGGGGFGGFGGGGGFSGGGASGRF